MFRGQTTILHGKTPGKTIIVLGSVESGAAKR